MLSCLVLNVFDIQEDIENWIVVKKIAKTIKKRLDIKKKKGLVRKVESNKDFTASVKKKSSSKQT